MRMFMMSYNNNQNLPLLDEIRELAASLEDMFQRMGITEGKAIAVVKTYMFNQLLRDKTKPEVYGEFLKDELKTYSALYLVDRMKEGKEHEQN